MGGGDKSPHVGLKLALYAHVVRHGNAQPGRDGNRSQNDHPAANPGHGSRDAENRLSQETALHLLQEFQCSRNCRCGNVEEAEIRLAFQRIPRASARPHGNDASVVSTKWDAQRVAGRRHSTLCRGEIVSVRHAGCRRLMIQSQDCSVHGRFQATRRIASQIEFGQA